MKPGRKISKAFTLIELLIVIAILGILAAVALPQYDKYVVRAQVGEAIQQLSALKGPLSEHYQRKRKFPSRVTSVASAIKDTGAITYISALGNNGANGNVSIVARLPSISSSGLNVVLYTEDGGLQWRCKALESNLNEYLPANCRN